MQSNADRQCRVKQCLHTNDKCSRKPSANKYLNLVPYFTVPHQKILFSLVNYTYSFLEVTFEFEKVKSERVTFNHQKHVKRNKSLSDHVPI